MDLLRDAFSFTIVLIAENSLNDVRHSKLPQIGIGLSGCQKRIQKGCTYAYLPAANENDGLSRNICHGKGSPDLIQMSL